MPRAPPKSAEPKIGRPRETPGIRVYIGKEQFDLTFEIAQMDPDTPFRKVYAVILRRARGVKP